MVTTRWPLAVGYPPDAVPHQPGITGSRFHGSESAALLVFDLQHQVEVGGSGGPERVGGSVQASTDDLAQRVGCTEALVSTIETGRAEVERELKERIARVLEVETREVGA